MTASKKSETPAPMASVATTTTQDLPDEAAKRARLAELDRLIADQEARLGQRAEAAVGATPAPFVFDEHATVEEVEHLARGQEEAVRQLNRDMARIEAQMGPPLSLPADLPKEQVSLADIAEKHRAAVEHNANLTEWRIDSFEIEYVEIGRAVVWWPVSKMLNRPLHDLLMSSAERQQVSDDIAERLRDAD